MVSTIWESPEGGFIKFAVKRASKQDQTLHIEGKLHVILYFREECPGMKNTISIFVQSIFQDGLSEYLTTYFCNYTEI